MNDNYQLCFIANMSVYCSSDFHPAETSWSDSFRFLYCLCSESKNISSTWHVLRKRWVSSKSIFWNEMLVQINSVWELCETSSLLKSERLLFCNTKQVCCCKKTIFRHHSRGIHRALDIANPHTLVSTFMALSSAIKSLIDCHLFATPHNIITERNVSTMIQH